MSDLSPKNSIRTNLSRRGLLKTAAAASVATIVPRHVLGGPNHIAPSDKVNVAIVGVGGRIDSDPFVPGSALPIQAIYRFPDKCLARPPDRRVRRF